MKLKTQNSHAPFYEIGESLTKDEWLQRLNLSEEQFEIIADDFVGEEELVAEPSAEEEIEPEASAEETVAEEPVISITEEPTEDVNAQ